MVKQSAFYVSDLLIPRHHCSTVIAGRKFYKLRKEPLSMVPNHHLCGTINTRAKKAGNESGKFIFHKSGRSDDGKRNFFIGMILCFTHKA